MSTQAPSFGQGSCAVGEEGSIAKKNLDGGDISTPRRALGDKKNVFLTPVGSAIKKKSDLGANADKKNSGQFSTFSKESRTLGTVPEASGDCGASMTQDQCDLIDPDAPVEKFDFCELPERFEDYFPDVEQRFDVGEAFVNVNGMKGLCRSLFATILSDKEYEELEKGKTLSENDPVILKFLKEYGNPSS